MDELFTCMFQDLGEHSQKAEGVGQLLFQMCKGVRNMFHSCAHKVSVRILYIDGRVMFPESRNI